MEKPTAINPARLAKLEAKAPQTFPPRDHAGDIAKYKGIVEAIDTAQVKSGCKKTSS